MIVGEPNEDSSLRAVSVIVIPEGMAMPFGAGRGGFGGFGGPGAGDGLQLP